MNYTSPRFPTFEFAFGRVNVILGANGSGKSKLLSDLKDHASQLTGGFKAAYIEGGRTIKLKDVLQLEPHNVGQYDRLEAAQQHYLSKRSTSLADRVFDALLVLDRVDAQRKGQHSDLVAKWIAEGQKGECPRRAQPPLEHFFELFSEIFPLITLSYDSNSRRLSTTKNGESYGPSGLSDGEKQVFSIVADLIELDSEHRLIVADEPELNLHPELAERVWTLLENEFPDKTFIYATHSIGFALRSSVDRVWVLSADSNNIAAFSGLDALPRSETIPFLGGLPGILSANRVLVTEGHEKAFDAIFYRWVLQDNKLEIYPAGGCTDVSAIVTKQGLWDRVTSKIDLRGVIDADFRDAQYLETLGTSSLIVLPLHEAESYLCVPEVLCAVAARIGSKEHQITPEEVRKMIFARLADDRLAIAARRVFAKARIALGVSVERKIMASISSREQLLEQMATGAEAELAKAQSTLAPDQLATLLDEELSGIDKALNGQDVLLALRLLPAKDLLSSLAPKAGCRTGADLMRSVTRNVKPADFDMTRALVDTLQSTAL